jgi:LCP family protein required for cell wall assembly
MVENMSRARLSRTHKNRKQTRTTIGAFGNLFSEIVMMAKERLRREDRDDSSKKMVTRTTKASRLVEPETPRPNFEKDPRKKPRRKKKSIWKKIGLFFLVLLLILGGFFAYGLHKGRSAVGGEITPETFNGTQAPSGATNILILGTDQRDYQQTADARSDSIMVLQLGSKDGKPKLVSFMRDTLVTIPGYTREGGSPNHKLNEAFTLGEQNGNEGAELMRKTLKANFGIDIEYYAMINFNSFATVIDSLFPGGVEIDAKFSTIGGAAVSEVEVPDDLNMKDGVVPNQTIKVGKQKMDGRTLLNYARFRKDDEGDYGRTRRQQQVLEAIVANAKSPATLFTGMSAIGTIRTVTSTDVPNSEILFQGLPAMIQAKNLVTETLPANGDWTIGYDMYWGQGLSIDYDKYRAIAQELLG